MEKLDSGLFELYTVQIALWREVRGLEVKLVDITSRSGLRAFAPGFDIVIPYKNGELSEEEYTKIYLERMKGSLEEYSDIWKGLLNYPKMAFACYCKADTFCHRHLFIQLAKEYLESHGKTVVLKGEIRKSKA